MDYPTHSEMVATNGINLHVMTAGPAQGEPVILLHGFPEFWYGWQHQIPALAEAGYRVIVPDQRGYNLSEKPAGMRAYSLDQLAGDVGGLLDHYGYAQTYLVGHDWGGIAAWYLARSAPERVKRLAILNVPHPSVMSKQLRGNLRQMRKSWYMFYFQLPLLPEASLRAANWFGLVNMLRSSSNPDTFSSTEIERYREAWAQPGALKAMLNWYRAMLRVRARPSTGPRIHVPTRILWGVKDIAFVPELAQLSLDLCDEGDLHTFENATHWLQHDEPQEVNRLLLEWLALG